MKLFITGISSGIGKELAVQAVRQGHEVWGLARRKELMKELEKFSNDKLRFSVCDISNESEMHKIANEMKKESFVPDAVILNAGVKLYDPENNIFFENVRNSTAVNINGALFWVSEFLPNFIQRGSGVFVAVSSTSALRPAQKSTSYSTSKAALDMAFRNLRLNFPENKVKFTTIRLGPVRTTMWEGGNGFLVSTPDRVAQFILAAAEKRSGIYYFPFLSTLIFRILQIMPDRTFAAISSIIKKTNG